MNRNSYNNFYLHYLLRFVIFFLLFYGVNVFAIGVTTPGGWYLPFVEQHLNYPSWIRTSVLYGAKVICSLVGYSTRIAGARLTNLEGTTIVEMGWPCYGLQIMSFWLAFSLASNNAFNNKIKWALGGLFAIWLTNCLRVGLLFISMMKNWHLNDTIDNHDMFKYASYTVVAIMIILYNWNQKPNSSSFKSKQVPSLV